VDTVAQVIGFIGIIVFLAHLFTGIFSRTKIPDVIFLILIGIFVGPIFGLVTPDLFGSVGPVFTTITLIIILFESGIALKLRTLRSVLAGAMLLAPLSFFLTMGVVAGLAIWLLNLDIIPAFILGAIVGSTSEAVVIPLVRQLDVEEETETLLSVESTVNDVLSIVITIALVQAYSQGSFELGPITGHLAASFFAALAIGVAGGFVWSLLLNRIRVIKNAIFTTPAFVFILFGAVEMLGFSGPITALVFGITIGNIERLRIPVFKKHVEAVGLSDTERVFFSEVSFLLKTFFFIYMGISLQFISGLYIWVGLLMVVAAFMVRVPAVRLCIRKKLPRRDLNLMTAMVPKGLAAVVLASIPLQEGIPGGEMIKNVTYGVIIISIVLTSILVIMQGRKKKSEEIEVGGVFDPERKIPPKAKK